MPLAFRILCLCFFVSLNLAAQAVAQDLSESDLGGQLVLDEEELELDEEELVLDDEEFEFEEDGELEYVEAETENRSLLSRLTQNTHITYSHLVAFETKKSDPPIINRSRLRLQWENSFGNHFFIRFDGNMSYDDVFTRSEYDAVETFYLQDQDVREFYLQYSQGPISLKLGRQLVVWGKADSGVVTDVFSPRDYTELLFTPLESARISQTLLAVDYYLSNDDAQKRFSFIVNPDIKSNRYALSGHPYALPFFGSEGIGDSGFSNMGEGATLRNEITPDVLRGQGLGTDYSEAELGFRWGYSKGKVDYAFLAADLVDNDLLFSIHSELIASDDFFALPQLSIELKPEFKRYKFLGGGFNWSSGNWVLKGEGAIKHGVGFNNLDTLAIEEHNRWDFAVGFDYSANGQYNLSMELSHQHIVGWHDELSNVKGDLSSLYAVWQKNFLHETLVLQLTAMYQLQGDNAFGRSEIEYKFSDYGLVSLQWDVFSVDKSDFFMSALTDRDRLALKLQFDL